ncbi:MAG: hypothetical protein IMW89_03585 [Ktedonobacteraceae bacterium]|nr:hypothetical protein [Ktedonobacteraceae bacterium]
MPVLEQTDDRIVPKSLLRYRPISDDAFTSTKSGKSKSKRKQEKSVTATSPSPVAQRASRSQSPLPSNGADVAELEIPAWKRITADGEAHEIQQPQAKAGTARQTTVKIAAKTPIDTTYSGRPVRPASLTSHLTPHLTRTRLMKRWLQLPPAPRLSLRAHPLLYLGIGMLAMFLLWLLVSTFLNWANTTLDNLRYGYPRTFQTDARVGHHEQSGTPSHFIAVNLHRHIQIIEIAGGDPAHTRIYTGPQLYGPNDDLTPVTLSFVDVNGDHRPDMLVNFQNSRIIFINDQEKFRPILPSERPKAEQALQHMQP